MQIQSREVRNRTNKPQFQMFIVRHQLALFYAIALAWAWALWIPMALHAIQIINFPMPLIIGQSIGAFSPLGTALILEKLSKGGVSNKPIISHPGAPRTPRMLLGVSIAIFPLLGITASLLRFGLDPSKGLEVFVSGPLETLRWGLIVVIPVQYCASLLSSPLFEEPGWRGFALTRLQTRLHPALASAIVGVLWWAWHVPINIANGLAISPLGFVGMIGTSFLIDTLFRKSGNRTLVAMLCHGGTVTGMIFFAAFSRIEMVACTWIAVVILVIVWKKR